MDKYYSTFRWDGWEKDVATLTSTQGISCVPPLWTKECETSFSTKAVNINEALDLQLEFAKTL